MDSSTARISKLEYQILSVLWRQGEAPVRDVLRALAPLRSSSYRTIQTTVFRMEAKGLVKRIGKNGTAYLFAPAVARELAEGRLIEELIALFGGQREPVVRYISRSRT